MKKYVAGLILPSGESVSPEEILVGDHTHITELVGGYFDVVTTNCGDTPNCLLLGFINDESAINGSEMNFLATNLFKKELFGTVVVVWGLDEDNIYDGDVHDIPTDVISVLMETLEKSTATAYNMAAGMAGICNYAVENGIADYDEVMEQTIKFHSDAVNGNVKQSEANEFFKNLLSQIIVFTKDYDEDTPEGALRQFCEFMKETF